MKNQGENKIYVLGDNLNALSMIFESISLIFGKGTNAQIVINRPFVLEDSQFNNGLCNWTLIDQADFIPNATDVCYLAGMSGPSRSFLFENYENKLLESNYHILVHPSGSIAQNVILGIATRTEQSVIIGPMAKIGKACLINRGAIIGHHTEIGDFVNVNPGAIINGNCKIGSYTTIGSGSIINDGISIGSNCIIGSGSLVTKEIGNQLVVYGSPAKVIRVNI